MVEGRRPKVERALSLGFTVAGIVFMALVFKRTWRQVEASILPSVAEAVSAFTLIAVGLLVAERGWRELVGVKGTREVAGAFFTAQLGKYIPGGVWQAVGQVGMTWRAGVPMAVAATAFPIHGVTQAVAGGVLGATLVITATHLEWTLRALAGFGVASAVFLMRGWMERALRLVRPRAAEAVPPQAAIVKASGWSVLTLIASGGALAILAANTEGAPSPFVVIPAFALAWTVGFLALPFPSGLGVREAVLVLLLGQAAPVIAISVIHRLLTLAAEAVLIVATRIRR